MMNTLNSTWNWIEYSRSLKPVENSTIKISPRATTFKTQLALGNMASLSRQTLGSWQPRPENSWTQENTPNRWENHIPFPWQNLASQTRVPCQINCLLEWCRSKTRSAWSGTRRRPLQRLRGRWCTCYHQGWVDWCLRKGWRVARSLLRSIYPSLARRSAFGCFPRYDALRACAQSGSVVRRGNIRSNERFYKAQSYTSGVLEAYAARASRVQIGTSPRTCKSRCPGKFYKALSCSGYRSCWRSQRDSFSLENPSLQVDFQGR
jgi:hypothetical protein